MPTPVSVSFEFFPPADEAAMRVLEGTAEQLKALRPSYVSVTCGAGGSVRSRTRDCVWRLLDGTSLTVAPHMTCIDSVPADIASAAAEYWERGIRHVVALRGDRSRPAESPAPGPSAGERYEYAADLVRALSRLQRFEIAVAAYPEGHPESASSVEADIENVRRKIDAGASSAITQFFFDVDVFLRYRDRLAAAGSRIPLVPGILPVLSLTQLLKFAQQCGATVPVWLQQRFAGLETDAPARRAVASEVVTEQVRRLREHGVDSFHFYTLNRAELTLAACRELGIFPAVPRAGEVAR